MKKHFWSICLLIVLISSCDKEIGGSNGVNGSLNLELVNGDYIAKDADAVFNASQQFYYYHIIIPPDTAAKLSIDTSSGVLAKYQYKNTGKIYYGGVLMFNNDTIPFNTFGGYRESSNGRLKKAIFDNGSNWNLEGNTKEDIGGVVCNNSGNIPYFELSTIPEVFSKVDGIKIAIISNNLKCNRLIAVIKYGDSIKYQAEFPINSDSIIIEPSKIQHLESDYGYELIIKAKNYSVSTSKNRKTYFQNELLRNYLVGFKPN